MHGQEFATNSNDCILFYFILFYYYYFFCNIIKVNHFLYCFIILIKLTSYLLENKSLLVLNVYASGESIDCIHSVLILVASPVKALYYSLLNLCWDFNINLSIFMKSFYDVITFSKICHVYFSRWFILFSNWLASKQFLLSNLSCICITHFFVPFHSCCLLNSCRFLPLIQRIFSWFFFS